jgi:hypothetical protein
MTDETTVPKAGPKRKKKIGFHSFTEEEFNTCLARLIEEDRDILRELGIS